MIRLSSLHRAKVTSAIHLGSDSKVFVSVIVIAVIVAVHLIFQINGDGANGFEAVQLLSVYLILGILLFYLPRERTNTG